MREIVGKSSDLGFGWQLTCVLYRRASQENAVVPRPCPEFEEELRLAIFQPAVRRRSPGVN